MATRSRSSRPSAASRFGWHPEPALIGVDDVAASRPALEALGRARPGRPGSTTCSTRLSAGPSATPTGYAELRRTFYAAEPRGPRDGPGPAPAGPTPSAEVLAEFRTRLAPYQLNAWHPRTLSYFTPPPLPMSIAGELLAQFTNQGIDVWHAGPSGAFVEEEVGRWLCDLVGYGPASRSGS